MIQAEGDTDQSKVAALRDGENDIESRNSKKVDSAGLDDWWKKARREKMEFR